MILPVFNHLSRYYYDWIIINQAFAISAFVFPLKVFNLFYFSVRSPYIVSFERLNPTIFFGKSPYRFLKKILYYFSIRLSDIVMSNSLEQVFNFLDLMPNKKVFYVPNTSSITHLSNYANKIKKRSISSKKKIIWIGRLESIKRPLLALKSLKYLPTNWILYMYGSGKMLDDCNRYIESNGLTKRVKLLNAQSIDFSEYNCLLNTSSAEGLPNIIIEALGSNLPIISCRFRTGLLELFIPFWTYLTSDNPKSIALTILKRQAKSSIDLRCSNPVSNLISNHYSNHLMVECFMIALKSSVLNE